jgi:hypothetical protein
MFRKQRRKERKKENDIKDRKEGILKRKLERG